MCPELLQKLFSLGASGGTFPGRSWLPETHSLFGTGAIFGLQLPPGVSHLGVHIWESFLFSGLSLLWNSHLQFGDICLRAGLGLLYSTLCLCLLCLFESQGAPFGGRVSRPQVLHQQLPSAPFELFPYPICFAFVWNTLSK